MTHPNLSDLNPQQLQAVLHFKGPAAVIAGPGSGKTKTLTKRAAYLVSLGVQPERILLITFTRASSQEMLDRAKALDSRCEFISGGTFHATAAKVIRRYAHAFGLSNVLSVLDQGDAIQVIKSLVYAAKGDDQRNWPRAETIAKIISYASNTKLSLDIVLEKRWKEYAEFAPELKIIRRDYAEYKMGKSLLDYDDCLIYFAALLNDPAIGPKVRNEWDFVMIDEYQDTNALQLDIVYGLANADNNIMCVGDPSQAIYGFRGSAPSTVSGFTSRFPETNIIPLETNYRSNQEIIDIVNAIDESMQFKSNRTLNASRGSGLHQPTVFEVADSVAEARSIADQILEYKDQGGEVADNAVLVRSMSFARRIEAEFLTRKIPYRVIGGMQLNEAAHIKDLLSIARIALNPLHEPAWLRILQRYQKIGQKTAEKITNKLIEARGIADAITILNSQEKHYKRKFTGLAPSLATLINGDDVAENLTRVVGLMEPLWKTIWHEDWLKRRKDIDAILLISAEYPSLDSFLTNITLDNIFQKKSSTNAEKQEENPVIISTVHGAKGLEWPVVHIPSFIQGHMPSTYATTPDEIEEEKRIFYVATSRAMDQLNFYRPAFDHKNNFNAISDFQPIIDKLISHQTLASMRDPITIIETNATIDMRSILLAQTEI